MELAVRRFARKILFLHLGLLVIILAVVYLASREINQSAREQALRQAQSRQELLANQTARGIEGFYQSILSDLDLLPPAETVSDEAGLINSLTGNRARLRSALPQRRNMLGPLLARQLEERVDYLFVFEKARQAAYDVSKADGAPDPALPNGPVDRIVKSFGPFLKGVDTPTISPFQMIDGRGINLVCQPLPRLSAVLVAVVSVERINQDYLKPLNDDPATGAFLVNDSLTAMAASRQDLVGADLGKVPDPQVNGALQWLMGNNFQGSRVLGSPFKLGDESFEPAVVTAVPVQVSGKRWFVLVSSPLAEVDSVVKNLFQKIVVWVVFVVVAVTGVLVSTAIQIIRSRVRLERDRHEVLKRELERARQIQQAWLPRAAPACRRLDIAAVNYPAQHISGDFYNWFDLPGGKTAIVIGDVTGHGMSAAFLMATTQLLVRTTMERVNEPGQCLTEVNQQLCTQVFNGQFVTMQVMVIDPIDRQIHLATAGHPAPLLAEGFDLIDGARGTAAVASPIFKPLKLEPQLVLGVDADTVYETEHFTLPPGAILLLYTDGAADVQSPDGGRLGSEGLRRSLSNPAPSAGKKSEIHAAESLAGSSTGDARAFLDTVVHKVDAFRGSAALGDDLTLVAFRLQGTPRPAIKRPTPVAALP